MENKDQLRNAWIFEHLYLPWATPRVGGDVIVKVFVKSKTEDNYEVPGVNYILEFYYDDEFIKRFIVAAEGDGYMMNEMANERRINNLQLAVSLAEYILHRYDFNLRRINIVKTVDSCIPIYDLNLPLGWVKLGKLV